MSDERVELVAQAIYKATWSNVADDPHEYQRVIGHRPKLWKADPSRPDLKDLAEHERDDYRYQARAAIAAIEEHARAAPPPQVECFNCRSAWSVTVQAPPYVAPTCSRCGKPCTEGHWVVAPQPPR